MDSLITFYANTSYAQKVAELFDIVLPHNKANLSLPFLVKSILLIGNVSATLTVVFYVLCVDLVEWETVVVDIYHTDKSWPLKELLCDRWHGDLSDFLGCKYS